MRTEQEPTITQAQTGRCDPHDEYSHPAYGTVTMSLPTGGSSTLFGSDIGHNQCVCIRISQATLKRDLNRDWIHSQGQLLEFSMSHAQFAQFAQFITSQGNGSGTPVTLKWIKGTGDLPEIKNIETKYDMHRREISDAAKERMDAISKRIADLGEMIESGKLPKKDLREIHKDLAREAAYLPGTINFVIKSAEKALEKATSDAKIEVESFIASAAQRIGLKHINELAMIENKES